ncbi:hypothetical protein B0J14DRAFT_352275 [Halenospora varia]|nr:hypothetical protein B0J14DRAFT_352275 [Halenospora varia]
MPPEASRKRRRTGPGVEPLPEPIVIMTPGIQPDVRLVVLELYSNYFRQFLDSPDKASSSTSFGQFKHDYATIGLSLLARVGKFKKYIIWPWTAMKT